MDRNEIKIRIAAWDERGSKIYREYLVPMDGEMNVLNALEYVHIHLDPSVSYQVSCRRGVCGACLMTIDGKKRLACETEVKDGMKIDPFSDGGNNA